MSKNPVGWNRLLLPALQDNSRLRLNAEMPDTLIVAQDTREMWFVIDDLWGQRDDYYAVPVLLTDGGREKYRPVVLCMLGHRW